MTPHSILFTLSAIGISEAAYLIRMRRAAQAPVCPIGENCTTVLSSKYNRIFGVVHNDVAGLVSYILIALAAAFLVNGVEPVIWWSRMVQVLVASGAVFSFLLLYLQWRVIRAWCFWCIMSAITLFGMLAVILTQSLII
ncbi:MAG: vitamin K epoxide reductase family protein [Candidatus Niyogibacteria bacterium]|nr:vitamin K epoxide reductase family protein [Candidatus Niyogibacteria bacterium]